MEERCEICGCKDGVLEYEHGFCVHYYCRSVLARKLEEDRKCVKSLSGNCGEKQVPKS